jgi:hypothetical protein
MKTYESVGFVERSGDAKAVGREDQDGADVNIIDSIPRQVQQFWMQIPTQYRLLYLLAFLYAH